MASAVSHLGHRREQSALSTGDGAAIEATQDREAALNDAASSGDDTERVLVGYVLRETAKR